MIGDDRVRSAPQPRPLARPSRSSAARPRTPTCTSRLAKPSTASTWSCPDIVQDAMDRFAALTGRQYHLFEYYGAPDAERVIVVMGSGAETAHETRGLPQRSRARRSACSKSGSTGPSPSRASSRPCPPPSRAIAVLDRTKEPGSQRRAAVHGLRQRDPREPEQQLATSAATRDRRRALRPFLQRVHPRHGQGRLRQPLRSRSPRITSPWASTTT